METKIDDNAQRSKQKSKYANFTKEQLIEKLKVLQERAEELKKNGSNNAPF